MKKLLSVILAVMMLALPVFSLAEEAAGAAVVTPAVGPTARYMLQGQEGFVDVTVADADMLMALMGTDSDSAQGIKDLLNALVLQFRSQTTGKEMQVGMDVQLGGKSVTGVTLAMDSTGFYASSNLLGEGICAFTPEEIQKLTEKAAQQEGAANPFSAIMGMLNGGSAGTTVTVDTTALTEAMQKLLENAEMGAVETAPEQLPDAISLMKLTLTRENLKAFLTEVGKMIWAAPGVANLMTQVMQIKDEESLISALTSVVDSLEDDVVVNIYMNKSQATLVLTDIPLKRGSEKAAPVSLEVLYTPTETGAGVKGSLAVPQENSTSKITFDVTPAKEGTTWELAMKTEDEKGEWSPMVLSGNVTSENTDTTAKKDADIRVSVWPSRDGDPMAFTLKLTSEDQDLGDHAESMSSFSLGMDMMGTPLNLVTLNAAGRTALAEAYIITEDATHPLAGTEEEIKAWTEGLSANVNKVMMEALQQLPESTLKLLTAPSDSTSK